MAAFNTISPRKLARLIGTPDCPVLIDVRIEEDTITHPVLIPSARSFPFDRATELADDLQGKHVVVICHKGKKLSHGTAAALRTKGVSAVALETGIVGWVEEGLPTIDPAALLGKFSNHPSRWVTRQRPKVDRVACAWFLRRFVDPTAQFLFVPTAEVDAVAERFSATAFDTPTARWTHVGELCTFDAFLAGAGIVDTALSQIAAIVRAADTGQAHENPHALGLLAFSVGLSRLYRSDMEQVDAAMTYYDALYRWARDAQGETHAWPQGHGQ